MFALPFRKARKRTSSRFHAAGGVQVVRGLTSCPSCGLFQRIGDTADGMITRCSRCGRTMIHRNRTSPVATPLAFCISSAALYLATLTSSLMTLNLYGQERTVDLVTGPMELLHEGWGEIGILVALVTILAPGVVICLMGMILTAATRPRLPDWAPVLLKLYEQLRPWSMMEVYILGIFVAYTKLVDIAYVEVGPATYLIGILMLTMAATDQTLDQDIIWRQRRIRSVTRLADERIVAVKQVDFDDNSLPKASHTVCCSSCGLVTVFPDPVPLTAVVAECPRCGHQMRRRKPNSINRTSALLLTAFIFYIPANILPVMTYVKLGSGSGHTIISGVIELWEAGLIPLSLLVLFASITVPVAKIVGLTWMLIDVHFHLSYGLLLRTKLYRVIEAIGRWSMIDVFMISILVAMVRFSEMANVTANAGVVSFAAVVIITIFAAHAFDPRLMWDVAGKNGQLTHSSVNRRAARKSVHS